MSDLIRREDVANTIQRICDICGEQKKYNGVMCGSCYLDTFVLDEIPSAEQEQRWTPISECLPAEEKDVLVTVRFDGYKDGIKPTTYVEVAHQIDGEWSSYSDDYKVARNRHHVLAWMPLPEPWRGE